MLSQLNNHERDLSIEFIEDTHTYIVRGDSSFVSVTTLVHRWFEDFDPDKIIQKMMRSSRWRESKYFGQTPEEIKAGWETKRDLAASAGTFLHKCIEDYYNQEPFVQPPPPEFDMFLRYQQEVVVAEGLIPFRTEWFVFDEELCLAGSIDMIYTDVHGDFYIYDWKRTELLKEENHYQSALSPLEHVPDTNYWHYCLQLNTYKHLLEKNYGVLIRGMYLVCIHPNNPGYVRKAVVDMSEEIEKIMTLRVEELQKKT